MVEVAGARVTGAVPAPGRHRSTAPAEPDVEAADHQAPRDKVGRSFRPDVQGLRAIAVAMVVIYHLYPSTVPGGYVGVDVFFAISGFLITGHLLRTFERSGRVGLLEFYGRRARRLMPAAALVLTVTWFASRIALPSTQLPATAEQIRASALYFQNWVLAHDAVSYLKSNDAPSPVQHFWSLSVEEQFYLVWPLLFVIAAGAAWLVTRRLRATGAPTGSVVAAGSHVGATVLFGLGALVVVASLWYSIYETRANPQAAYFVTTTRIWELGLGGALALLSRRISGPLSRIGVLGWAGLAAVITSAFVINDSTAFPGSIALLPVVGATLLIACGSAAARLGPARLTSLRPMVFVGDISYSLYLWHWPIIVLWKRYSGGGIGYLDGPAIAVASIILAWLTKVLVEDRVRLAPFITRSPVRSLATVLAVAVPVAFVAVFIASEPPPFSGNLDAKHPGAAVLAGDVPVPASASPEPPLISAPRDFAISSNSTCLSASSVPSRCEFGDQKAPVATVALVGDSLAGQWSSVLDVIAKKQHWRLVVETHSGCPFGATVIVHPGSGGKPDTGCHDWGTAVLRDLLTDIKPDVVITSDSPTDGTLADPKANSTARAEIGSGMADYWKQLQAAGISVVAIAESPSMVGSGPDCLSSRTGSVKSCSRPAAKAIFHATPLEKAASLAPSSRLIDLNSLICGKTTCLPVVGNVVVYRDQHHLTKTYTLTLEPYLRKLLLAVQALKPAGG